jgi:hypothetical protein
VLIKYQAILMYRLRFARGCAFEPSLLRFAFALPSKSFGELIVSSLAFAELELIVLFTRPPLWRRTRMVVYENNRGGGKLMAGKASYLR